MSKGTLFTLTLFLVAVLFLSSCAGQEAPPDKPVPFEPVLSDGVFTVEARTARDNGSLTVVELRITNGSEKSVAVSSALGVKVNAGGSEMELLNAKELGLSPIDGLIEPGSTAQGFIAFADESLSESCEVAVAVDLGKDDWLTFTLETTGGR